MRVVCDSCGASYKIPDSKLTKEVNKATCRKCGHAIFIRRAGEDDPKPISAAPAPVNEERTLITSAADLERQARARAGAAFDDSADQRPTTVSIDNGPPEATVPREPAQPASFAPAAFPPPPAPAPFAPAAAPAAFPHAAPFTPAPAPAAFPPPPAAFAPAPARPAEPVRSAPISPSAEAPPAFARPADPTVAVPPPAAAAPAAAAGHDPRTDLSVALVALFMTVIGVLVLSVSSVLANPVIAGLGAFVALLGTFVVAFILLTGGRGTKPASLVVSFVGGFFLSAAAGAALSGGLYALAPSPAQPAIAALTPPAPAPVEAPPAAPAEPAPAEPVAAEPPADPAAALADATPAEPPAEPPPAPAPVAAPPPAPTPAPASKPTASAPSSSSTRSPASSSKPTSTASRDDDAPVRIQPSSTSSSKPASTSSKPTTSSSTSGASSSSAPKSTGVSAVVIDTMIKSNKGVKGCFVTQRNETGDLPRGVKVKLTIQPSGKVSSAGIPSGEWAGTSFDDCLSGAVKSIQFPPFDGDSATVTYPFSI